MAEPTARNAKLAAGILDHETSRESEEVEKQNEKSNSSAQHPDDQTGPDGTPDPLANLPEKFRKELEAQSVIVSRKVSFKVRRIFPAFEFNF